MRVPGTGRTEMIELIDGAVSKEKVWQKECSKGRCSGRHATRMRHVDSSVMKERQ